MKQVTDTRQYITVNKKYPSYGSALNVAITMRTASNIEPIHIHGEYKNIAIDAIIRKLLISRCRLPTFHVIEKLILLYGVQRCLSKINVHMFTQWITNDNRNIIPLYLEHYEMYDLFNFDFKDRYFQFIYTATKTSNLTLTQMLIETETVLNNPGMQPGNTLQQLIVKSIIDDGFEDVKMTGLQLIAKIRLFFMVARHGIQYNYHEIAYGLIFKAAKTSDAEILKMVLAEFKSVTTFTCDVTPEQIQKNVKYEHSVLNVITHIKYKPTRYKLFYMCMQAEFDINTKRFPEVYINTIKRANCAI